MTTDDECRADYTPERLAQIDEERAYWQKYADFFCWAIGGWTYKTSAIFHRKDGSVLHVGDAGHIRASDLDMALNTRTPALDSPEVVRVIDALERFLTDWEKQRGPILNSFVRPPWRITEAQEALSALKRLGAQP